MAWGLPPKYEEKRIFSSLTHQQLIDKTKLVAIDMGFKIKSESAYTLQADKVIGFTFLSLFGGFTKPKLILNVRADEDRNLTIKISYTYARGRGGSFNDLGKSKEYVLEIFDNIL
tara:strand:+ start:162 stop:506 length:345 start_codon:yes stop_codon:yes gene_type:complete